MPDCMTDHELPCLQNPQLLEVDSPQAAAAILDAANLSPRLLSKILKLSGANQQGLVGLTYVYLWAAAQPRLINQFHHNRCTHTHTHTAPPTTSPRMLMGKARTMLVAVLEESERRAARAETAAGAASHSLSLGSLTRAGV